MLIFDESQRPSFVELSKMLLPENSAVSAGKQGAQSKVDQKQMLPQPSKLQTPDQANLMT